MSRHERVLGPYALEGVTRSVDEEVDTGKKGVRPTPPAEAPIARLWSAPIGTSSCNGSTRPATKEDWK
jgi:hypothetical protein